jgi:hypothetical protein
MRTIIRTVLAIGISITAASCDNKPKLVTITLYPTENSVAVKQNYDHNAMACLTDCGSHSWPACPFTAPTKQISKVGYSNNYDAGTQPCACWSLHDCAWRGYFGFDFSPLPSKKVVAATLHFTADIHQSEGNIAPGGTATCTIKLYKANEPFSGKYGTAGDLISTPIDVKDGEYSPSVGFPTATVDLQIGSEVIKWVNGQEPNYGMFLIGPKESVTDQNNDHCILDIKGLSLNVIVNTA